MRPLIYWTYKITYVVFWDNHYQDHFVLFWGLWIISYPSEAFDLLNIQDHLRSLWDNNYQDHFVLFWGLWIILYPSEAFDLLNVQDHLRSRLRQRLSRSLCTLLRPLKSFCTLLKSLIYWTYVITYVVLWDKCWPAIAVCSIFFNDLCYNVLCIVLWHI